MSGATDIEAGFRSLQLAAGASAICGFCGYFAAKQLSKPFVEETVREHRAMIFTVIGIGAVVIATVYSFFVVYKASMRTKMFAMIAVLIALGGSYGGWTIGWKKGGDPTAMKVL